jgi:hypothetical protein
MQRDAVVQSLRNHENGGEGALTTVAAVVISLTVIGIPACTVL